MESSVKKWRGGHIYTWNDRSIPAGLQQGDGVFETLRTFDGMPFLLDQHAVRLIEGARTIGLKDLPDPDEIESEVRGQLSTKRAMDPSSERVIRFAIFHDGDEWGFNTSISSWTPSYGPAHEGTAWVGYSAYPHPGRYLIPPESDVQVKWVSRGPLAHALREAKNRGWDEALLMNRNKSIVEGTRSNVFAINEGVLLCPGPKSYALPGVTRSVVVDCASELDLEIRDQPIPVDTLEASDEIFITSSLLGIAPVSRIINGSFSRDCIGKVTRSLTKEFEKRIKDACAHI